MNDFLSSLNKPVNVFTVNAPPENKDAFLNRDQARAKENKEKEDLRRWWDDLPEDKRQEVRDQQFYEKKKPEVKKPKPKAKTPPASDNEEEKKKKYIIRDMLC
jgi:hypothetical protein